MLHERQQLDRAQTAVQAYDVRSQSLQEGGRRLHRSSREHFPLFVQGHCGEHRKGRCLLGCQHRCL